jgi:hypothetical protein
LGKRWLMLFCVVLTAMLIAAPTIAQETTTYTYDALGRLITSSISGGPNNGTQTGTSFDPASNRTNYTVTGTPLPPSFAIGNAPAVTEGGNLTFTVTKTGATSSSYSVNYATADDTATSGSDYTAASGTLTFAPGETTKQIAVQTLPDTLVEGNETVLVNLTAPTGGATITTAQGSGTINDDDASFAIGNAVPVTEGGTLTYTVTKTAGAATGSFSVSYATANGTATSGSDFTPASGTLTFAPGETAKQITVQTTPDTLVEGNETVLVNLTAPTGGATITTAQGSGTINDDDASFAIGNAAAVTEGGTLTYTVTKTVGAATGSFSVNYATANGTATSGSDFTATSGTLTFAAGETTKTIQVPTIDDSVVESAETVLVNLSSPTNGATITTAQGSGTINDNDIAFAIGNATAMEGGVLTFTVTKAGTTTSSYSVNYATASGTATSGSDFTATSGTLTFLPGDTTKTITVATIDDSVVEPTETVLVNLSSPTGNATITTTQGSGTILDNDVAFAVSNAAAVTEGGTLTFTVTRSGTTSSGFSVNYATASGTATSGSDFTATSGTLTFLASETTKTITVATIDDSVIESPETVLVNLSSPTGGATITTPQGSGTINDNDTGPVANADTTSFDCSAYQTVNLVANDTDPGNNVPLYLVSITGPGSATVTSSTSVTIGEHSAGTYTFSYVVATAAIELPCRPVRQCLR